MRHYRTVVITLSERNSVMCVPPDCDYNYAQMERETAHLLITGANWLTSHSSKLFGVALEGKDSSNHKPQLIENNILDIDSINVRIIIILLNKHVN